MDPAAAGADARLWLLDIEKLLAERSSAGLPGRNIFYEHVHLNNAGNDVVARAIGERIDAEAPPGNGPARPWLTPEQVSYQLGLTPWNQLQTARLLEQRLERAPFTHQLGHEVQMRRMLTEVAALEAALQPEALRQSHSQLQDLTRQATNDWVLARNYTRFLHQAGDDDAAISEWRRVVALIPQNAEAQTAFGRALELDPNHKEARLELGVASIRLNEIEAAVEQFTEAVRRFPGDPLAAQYLAQARARQRLSSGSPTR